MQDCQVLFDRLFPWPLPEDLPFAALNARVVAEEEWQELAELIGCRSLKLVARTTGHTALSRPWTKQKQRSEGIHRGACGVGRRQQWRGGEGEGDRQMQS